MDSAHGKTFGFGFTAMKKFPSLIPMVVIMGVAVTGCTSFIMYALANKKDVIVNRSNSLPPWERTDLESTSPSKIVTINQEYHADPQLIKLKKEMKDLD